MKAVGLITEYNPFHNGHLLHLKKALTLSGADLSIALMSGNFVQRGEYSITDKYTRAKAAVECGVNLVIEMPVRFAMGSAESFATCGILTLDTLGVSSVCFGSECGVLSNLNIIADVLANEPDKYQLALKSFLKSGLSFPAAREEALISLNLLDRHNLHLLLSSPNNILGIEYLKAIKRHAPSIIPYTYAREGMAYNELFNDDVPNELFFASAQAIRQEIKNFNQHFKKGIPESLKKYMPEIVFNILSDTDRCFTNIPNDYFEDIFFYKMQKLIADTGYDKKLAALYLNEYDGFTSYLASRTVNNFKIDISFDALRDLTKNKATTYTAVSRAFYKFILGHKKIKNSSQSDFTNLVSENDLDQLNLFSKNIQKVPVEIKYIRILAMDDKGRSYLNEIKKKTKSIIITKTSDYAFLLKEDIYAADLYNHAVFKTYKKIIPDEFHRGIYIKGRGFTGISF